MHKMKKRLHILVTAGPTRESIDPVRFISNRSTGVMGYEIAKAGKRRGHAVTLVSGPICLRPLRGVKFFPIETAGELKKAVLSRLKDSDCLFMVAAVSDWCPSGVRAGKIKRSGKRLKLTLEPTPDILKLAGKRKGKRILVGFSLETRPSINASRQKLKKKNLDLIVSNSFRGKKDPFGDKRIKNFVVYKTGEVEHLPILPKREIARLLLDRVEALAN